MTNILSSTSSAGAAAGQGTPAGGKAAPTGPPAPIGLPFGAHLGRKPQVPMPAHVARPIGELAAHALGQDPASLGTAGRAGQPGLEPVDDDKRRRSDEALTPTTGEPIDPLDPLTRALFTSGLRSSAVLAPLSSAPSATPPDDGVLRSSRVSLEHVLTRLVRRIAWSGDGQTGSARLELGAGALEGATLTIHSDQGKVRVSLELPPGVDQDLWKDRIARRLGARGLQVTSLEVD